MTSEEKEQFLAEIQSVIGRLENEFDSHEFIRKYIYNFPKSYSILIDKHGNISTAHGELANFLRLNSSKLHIIKSAEEVFSPDIFGNVVKNSKWIKM